MARHELRISAVCLHALARRLEASPAQVISLPIGRARHGDGERWFLHAAAQAEGDTGRRAIVVGEVQPSRIRDGMQRALILDGDDTVFLVVGIRRAAGHLAAVHRGGAVVTSMQEIVVVGPGWPRLPRADGAVERETIDTLSRTIAALGIDVYTKVRQLHIALVGCGRSGSLVADQLTSIGVGRLTLIDSDRLERHNLGEMACVRRAHVGRMKVDALAAGLRRGFTLINAIADSVLSFTALDAIKRADMIVTCPDSPAPRLAASILASAYLQPHLDIGTGIQMHAGRRQMGADVRLLLPLRCAVCLGGIPRLSEARDLLLTGAHIAVPADFRDQRLGSLRSLNSLAAALGMTMLEQFLSNRVRESLWLQLDVNERGLPVVLPRVERNPPACPVCAIAGHGDAAVENLPVVLRQLG